ncbi:putative FKBP-type peptidyl-prolyl cis-trans isomerase [Gemmata sp. SH-PL17]|uniref:FKBP-type peptidyl-prolyl cis-trans isomerase n=1 Tax=Gemmata sp. SH-PL17 TaxID=1630693 RepID=UPI0004B38949|nr:FKBP-type peptidyl-prolyl cis-trans isomerase [Gemmata sp. SH-PL17]AMV22803.1 putative FKBP-type peptidyl-prolyl cis-trans isomerase [Gemmata sp. SH-PL17]
MAEPGKTQPDGLDKQKIKQILVPALAIAAIVILVGLVVFVSDAAAPKNMSDGSNGSVEDPDLKEISAGVKYRDLKVGAGDECQPGADVKIHYTGWVPDGTVFDSSKERGQPATFPLKELIAGWQEGIPGMKPGGIRKLVIAPDKGYGKQSKGKIPANSTLVFEVELLSSSPPPRARRYPAPTDLTKLSDGTEPGADDPNLKPIGKDGLKCRDLKVGDGPECPEGARVVMDYTGWLTTGGKPFDSSWLEGKGPLNMSLGELVQGWQQGVPGMKVGGVRKLVIPASLGYGMQAKGAIPANSTLVFEIELLGFGLGGK